VSSLLSDSISNLQGVAVVLIDVQNDFCSPRGASAAKIQDIKPRQDFGIALEKFVKGARATGVKIIHVKTIHSEWTDNPVWLSRNKNAPNVCRMGSWGAEWWEEFPGFHPKSGEYIVTKHRYSAFVSTDLDMVLRCTGVKTIVIGGVATDTCVESTVRDAFVLGYKVVALSDCSRSKDDASHEASLKTIRERFGSVAKSDEVLAIWSEKVAPRSV
jgi:ureidoacrylate peracid hydrolase